MATQEDGERNLTVEEALELAVRLHRSGQLSEAEVIYRQVLKVRPDQPDALHFLGLLMHQQKKGAEAVEQIRRAIALAPHAPDFHNNLGNVLKEQGRLAEAAEAYRRVIALRPDHAAAYSNLGVVLKAQGDVAGAAAAYRKAIELEPGHVEALLNLGSVLTEQNKEADAIKVYEAVVAIKPDHPEAYYRLGHIYWDQGKPELAAEVFRKTTDLEPNHPDAYFALGNLFQQHERYEECIGAYRKSIEVNPRLSRAYKNLGNLLNILGRTAEAVALWEQWLKVEPDNPVPRHMIAAATGRNAPARAADDYVQRLFDDFARSFDAKLKNLGYRAPQLTAEAVAGELGPPRGELDVLDAGCGTGLCGPLLRPYARRLTGVDLSPKMLEKAKERGGYDALHAAELTDYIRRSPASFDLIVSADTLVYFGDLKPVLAAAAQALRPGGCLVFTLEREMDADASSGFRLLKSGRYCHAESYVRDCLREAGFRLSTVACPVLRMESLKPVEGLAVVARNGGVPAAGNIA
jgi:predicted TPR repeat methyltransferase